MKAVLARGRPRFVLGFAAALTVLAVLALLVGGVPGPAVAAPGPDDEGGTVHLQAALDKAAGGYNNARAKAQASQRKRLALTAQLTRTERKIAKLDAEVQALGAAAYRGGIPNTSTAMVNSRSLPDLLDNVGLLDSLSRRRQQTIQDLGTARENLNSSKKQIDQEVKREKAAEKTMAKRRSDAERALTAANVSNRATKGFTSDGQDAEQPAAASGGHEATESRPKKVTVNAAKKASQAKRRSDGTWGSEGCSDRDPTSSGCLTPRTLHALRQTQAAGFTHYVHCWRTASFGEHPKGRACDFAAAPNGFGGIATGADRAYGNRLAAWFIDNADRLGVLYVIWFRQIWLPGIGWRAYQSGDDPAASHRNHVHLSIQ